MIKTIKTYSYLAILSVIFVVYSCIDKSKQVERTPEMEAAELQDMLTKLIDQGKDIDTTANGVYYVVDNSGYGPTVKTGDTCSVEYVGYLPDGSLFATSGNDYPNTGGIMKFEYPTEGMIPGFNEGLTVMNKSAKIEMIIPSSLAFGELGSLTVPPYTTVILVTTLDDLKPVSSQ